MYNVWGMYCRSVPERMRWNICGLVHSLLVKLSCRSVFEWMQRDIRWVMCFLRRTANDKRVILHNSISKQKRCVDDSLHLIAFAPSSCSAKMERYVWLVLIQGHLGIPFMFVARVSLLWTFQVYMVQQLYIFFESTCKPHLNRVQFDCSSVPWV